MVVDVTRPVCFWCVWRDRDERERFVNAVDAVFESVCGHARCPSVVFHGLCLMEFRADERFQRARERNNAMLAWLWGEHDAEG